MTTYLIILTTIVVIALIGTIIVQSISAIKTNALLTKILSPATKPGTPTGIPQYLPYETAFKAFNNLITLTFQRIYTNAVLPNLTNSNRKINRLAPTDKNYSEYVQKVTLQVMESIPLYLYKSVMYYFGIVSNGDYNEDSKNERFSAYTKFIATKTKGLLDSKIVDIGYDIEKNGGSAVPILEEFKNLGKIYGLTPENVKSPDGTKPDFID